MTERIREFLRRRTEDGPCVVVDLDVVRDNYEAFARALPDTSVYYAVKANPAPEILSLLAELGSSFDCASVGEIEMVLAAGAGAERISYGNTIKKERDIARAFELGVRLFAVDSDAEVDKIARAAPGSKVFCRILCDGVGAEWPLSKKFGCVPDEALRTIAEALNLSRAEVHGVASFYHDFRKEPAGRHVLKICRAEACQSMGGDGLADGVRAALGIDWHETTPDGRVTLEPVYCLGLCSCAPAAMLDGELHGRLDETAMRELVKETGR